MIAITVWQPWAQLIAIGAKRFEFRNWALSSVHHGTRIAIHAGVRKPTRHDVHGLLVALATGGARRHGIFDAAAASRLLDQLVHDTTVAPLGAVVCTAIVDKPLRGRALGEQLGLDPGEKPTNNGWPLRDVELLQPPDYVRGAQGLWEWTPERVPA